MPDFRPVGFPAIRAGPFVEGDDVRRAVMVALMDQRVFKQQRRAGGAEAVFEDAVLVREGPLPDQAAVDVEAEEIAGTERRPQMLAVGDRGGARHAALPVKERRRRPPQPAMPALAARVAVETDDVQLSLIASVGGRQENAVVPDYGIGGPDAGNGDFPEHV